MALGPGKFAAKVTELRERLQAKPSSWSCSEPSAARASVPNCHSARHRAQPAPFKGPALADLLSDRLQTLRHVQSGASYNPLGARRASMHVHPKTAL